MTATEGISFNSADCSVTSPMVPAPITAAELAGAPASPSRTA
jgi:hypothetical protein